MTPYDIQETWDGCLFLLIGAYIWRGSRIVSLRWMYKQTNENIILWDYQLSKNYWTSQIKIIFESSHNIVNFQEKNGM